MRTISEMYQRSGGCDRRFTCAQCENCIDHPDYPKEKTCAVHPELPVGWHTDWMACQFAKVRRTHLPAPLEEVQAVQMSIFDLEGTT